MFQGTSRNSASQRKFFAGETEILQMVSSCLAEIRTLGRQMDCDEPGVFD